MVLRNAKPEDLPAILGCIEDAKEYQHALGFVQWHDGYPSKALIESDIESGIGYVFCENDTVLGYCCILFGKDPAYDGIIGAWKTDGDYGVVHRMAFSRHSRGRGLSKVAFAMIKDLLHGQGLDVIRMDTQEENVVMRHVLEREGFVHCGEVAFDNGPKLAYEWIR